MFSFWRGEAQIELIYILMNVEEEEIYEAIKVRFVSEIMMCW